MANRDIKLENILISNSTFGLIKLCDFGYSKVSACGQCVLLVLPLSGLLVVVTGHPHP